jgi:hypothetical protein
VLLRWRRVLREVGSSWNDECTIECRQCRESAEGLDGLKVAGERPMEPRTGIRDYASVCSDISRASSTSMPRYRTDFCTTSFPLFRGHKAAGRSVLTGP